MENMVQAIVLILLIVWENFPPPGFGHRLSNYIKEGLAEEGFTQHTSFLNLGHGYTLILSLFGSVITLVIGYISQLTAKRGFLPIKGKILMVVTNFCGISARLLAITLYFTPTLGLFRVLNHLPYGRLKFGLDNEIFDVDENGTQILNADVWKPLEDKEDLIVTEEYQIFFVVPAVCLIAHVTLVIWIKSRISPSFRKDVNVFGKVYHAIVQIGCPTLYQDWDFYVVKGYSFEAAWLIITEEFKNMTLLSTVQNFLLNVPLFVLHRSIVKRNHYLESRHYGTVPEEDESTKTVEILIAVSLSYYVVTTLIQLVCNRLFYAVGHPYASISALERRKQLEARTPRRQNDKVDGFWKLPVPQY